ncbi:MAG TPA: CDP-diacylglycerol--glycerol-3-phosphate 3-phosphatidyltransferase [Treponema sp.]|jgi:CDP-diacylglycerol--glycerol-3-phosphate 3-phosphatidyltransferase|nr:CDP-diacylglycerol--glycerol-3-phosphate 3-phosphatidyltransferase [Treponema sp.]
MTSADKITSVRLILAPIFFIVYFLPQWFPPVSSLWTVPVLWILFIIAELTDLLDGLVARSRNEVSDFGKLFDPFSDTLVRITYFLCFVVDGILPAILLMIVLYREFGILFLRTLMMKLGIAMGARSGGKLKAVTYMIAGVLALLASSIHRLSLDASVYGIVKTGAIIVFAISVVISLGSFGDYYRVYKNAKKI